MFTTLLLALALVDGRSTSDATALKTPIYKRTFPVTRAELFQRADGLTFGQCKGATSESLKNNCIAAAQARISACQAAASVPESIPSLEVFRAHVGPYIRCTQPVLVCKGVEIKSDADALRHCP